MKKITDEYGEKISSINLFSSHFYTAPFLITDKLRDKELLEKIKIFKDAPILGDIEFALYSKILKRKFCWARNQKFMFFLRPSEYAKEPGWRQLSKLPMNHEIHLDIANHKVRLAGPFSHPSGIGEWTYY